MLNQIENIMKPQKFIKFIFISMLCISFTSVNAQVNKHRKVQKQKHQKIQKHKPHYRYAKLPRWGYSTKVAPKNALLIVNKGTKYHYHSGFFYKHIGSKYKIVKAPIGIRVRTLPKGRIHFVHGTRKYFYYYGTYYVKSDYDVDYIIVSPPKGAKVNALPDAYKEVEIDGNEYFEFEGVFYKEVEENNEVLYEVVDTK